MLKAKHDLSRSKDRSLQLQHGTSESGTSGKDRKETTRYAIKWKKVGGYGRGQACRLDLGVRKETSSTSVT